MGYLHKVTNPAVEGQGGSHRYKFVYEEFEGERGYSVLCDILAAILPVSLNLTWLALTRTQMQKHEQLPYSGVGDLMKARARTDRKIQMDLKTFKNRELMVTTPGIELCGGRPTRVDYKDFTKLYELAHTYFEWTKTNDFLLYQPAFEDKESIVNCRLSDLSEPARSIVAPHQSLYKFLIQFENYHLKLECAKPGQKSSRKAARTPIDDGQSDECTTFIRVVDCQNPKYKFNPPSLYESHTSLMKGSEDAHDPPSQPVFCEDSDQASDAPRCNRIDISQNPKYKFNPPSENSEDAHGPSSQYAEIIRLCMRLAGKFHDQEGKNTLTDICELFERSKRSEKDFIRLMEYAANKTTGMPENQAKIRNLDGSTNKMSLFMSIVRDAVDASLTVSQLEEQDCQFAEQKKGSLRKNREYPFVSCMKRTDSSTTEKRYV